jgi:hypothetical protein
LYLLANSPLELKQALANGGDRLLGIAFDQTTPSFQTSHPYYWASELRGALSLSPSPSPASAEKVIDAAIRLSAAIEEHGLPILAFNTLDAAGAAFPPDPGVARTHLFLELGGIAERYGAYAQARDSYSDARDYAQEAGQRDLERDAEQSLQRVEEILSPTERSKRASR